MDETQMFKIKPPEPFC